MATSKGVGQPLKFQNLEKLQKDIDEFFIKCDGDKKPYTISGLAYALKTCRQTLLNYAERTKYLDTIKRAKLRIEVFWEQQLLTPKVTAGVSFNLKNNFGWKDKQEIHNTGDVTLKIDKDDEGLFGE